MASEEGKTRLATESAETTPDSGGRRDTGSHARMHFHSVHNIGERLRRGGKASPGRRDDRMEGR